MSGKSEASRDAERIGKGRELALFVLCHLESYPADERPEASALAFSAAAAEDGSGALAEIARLRDDAAARRFAERQVGRALSGAEEIDEAIESTSERWRLDRMHQVDRNLLRLAAVELMHDATPSAVVASEATRLAGRYGSETSARFVNGVVDALAKRLRG